MNIENIKTEIANILGGDYVIYYNTSIETICAEERGEKAFGIFRVSAGDVQPLTGVQGLSADCSLEMFLPCGNAQNRAVLRRYEGRLNYLLSVTNGIIRDIASPENPMPEDYRYLISYSVPRATGLTQELNGCTMQQYVLTFRVVLSSKAKFGNDITVKIDGEPISGILNWNELSGEELTGNLCINEFAARFIAQLNTYKLSLTCLRQDDAVQDKIQSDREVEKDTTYSVEVTINGKYNIFNATIERYSLTGVKGDFQTMELLFAKVREDENNG